MALATGGSSKEAARKPDHDAVFGKGTTSVVPQNRTLIVALATGGSSRLRKEPDYDGCFGKATTSVVPQNAHDHRGFSHWGKLETGCEKAR